MPCRLIDYYLQLGFFFKTKPKSQNGTFLPAEVGASFHVPECSLRQRDLYTCPLWPGSFIIGWRLPFHDPCFWVELRLYQKALLRADLEENNKNCVQNLYLNVCGGV